MIENCQFYPTSELNTNSFSEKLDSQEGMIGMGLTSTFHTILMQCSPQIFKVGYPEITKLSQPNHSLSDILKRHMNN